MPETVCAATATRHHQNRFEPAALVVALAAAFAAASPAARAQTLPTAGVAVHGQAAISSPAPNQLRVVTQNGPGTSHSAINWQSFSLSAGSSANFIQPSATSTAINRVVSNTPSAIFGTLSSNGRLVLVNQAGIAVGAGAVIDTAGFTASALRMTDADALAGRLRFGDANASMGGAAGITVGGRITARDGDVVLVAPNIDIGGGALLQSPNGSTILAAGQQVEITGRGLEGITLLVQAPSDQVRNLGRLEGDAVGIFAGTLRHSGEIQATTAALEGGRVVLKAAGDAYVDGAARIVATGAAGGRVDVLGDRVAVLDQAVVDASGTQGGGTIRVGGDFQGRNAQLPNARMTHVGVDTLLRADATQGGDGGRVIVWADEVTRAQGRISADAAPGGAGGFVETSGHRYLDVGGIRVTASGSPERPGTWLLDPADITITHGAATSPYPSGNKDLFTQVFGPGSQNIFFPVPSASVSTLTDGDLNNFLNGGSNLGVIVQTSNSPQGAGLGDITFDGSSGGAIVIGRTNNVNTNANQLVFNADRNIVFGSGSTTFQRLGASTALPLVVQLNPGITNAAGKIVTSAGASVVMNGVNDELGLTVKNGKVWDNAGTVTMQGQSIIRLPNEAGYATFNNQASGVLNVNASGTWSFLSDSNPQGGIVNNAGTINVNGTAGGNTTSWEAFYSNLAGGTLHLGAGKLLSMQNANVLGGNLVLDSGSELRLSQQFIGTPSVSNATFSGPGKLSVAGGVTANFSNNTGTLGQLDVQGTVSTVSGTLAVGDYAQVGGAFGGGGGLTVTNSFAHSGGSFVPSGNLSITQAAGNLAFNESVAVNALSLSAPTGGITLGGGPVTVSGTVALSASTGISQTGGSLVVNGSTTLTAPGSTVDLSLGSNDFTSIAGSTGALTVVDINNLAVGAPGINSSNGNVSLSATGIGNMTLSGNIDAGTGNVTLNSRGVTESGGAVTGSTLTVNSSLGSVSLNGANNVAAARLSGSGASTITFNNLNTNYALSGTGGSLTVTSPGQVTVDQPLNFASGIDITSTTGITLGANVTPGANLSLTTGAGPINQTAGALLANSGTATFSAGTGDVALFGAGNDFNVVNLAGQHISVVAANGLIVNSLVSGANRNVYLQAGAGGMILPGTPVNAGTGQISFISGSSLLGVGSLVGSDIILAASNALSVDNSITASGFLQLSAPGGGGISQAAGTSLVVGGLTSVNAGTGPIVLAQPGNNFSSVTATGGAITVHDANGLNFGAVNASTSLNVLTNGNVTQTAPLIIAGTTAIDAGSGNVTLTTAGNNLNNLSINANAIDVVEGAGSSLLVTALNSGANQPVRLVAGHTLTLPNSPINTGAGDLTLASNIGPLVVPQPLNGHNIDLSGAGGITVNATVNALSNVNMSVSTDTVTTINSQVNALGGSMSLNLAGGLDMTASNQAVRLSATSGQTINAKYVTVFVTGAGSSEIFNSSGPQTITTSGKDGAGNGLLVGHNGTGAGMASIMNNTGTQTITVNDADFLRVTNTGGNAEIFSSGNQTILVQGAAGANHLQVGVGGSAHYAEIGGNNQSITVGQPGQSGTISIVAGGANDQDSGIHNGVGTQTIKTVGQLNIFGGSAPGGAGLDCLAASGGTHVGSCGFIAQEGAGLQTVSASSMQLLAGGSGGSNLAVIGSLDPGASQLIELTGGGNLAILAGSGSGAGNKAVIAANGPSQTVNFLSGGVLAIVGGTVGSKHSAGVYSNAAGSLQTVTGATGIQLAAGTSGGGFGIGNSARLQSAGSQSITVGVGGLTITGGGGTGAESDNDAQVWQSGLAGTTQGVTVNNGGAITIVGGSSAKVNVGGSGHGSKAKIEADGDSQTITFTAGGAIDLTGGTNGSRAFAMIESVNGSQTISGAPDITMAGGANGGVDGEGNRAVITASAGSQSITAGSILMQGGASGIENRSVIFGATGQNLTATGLTMLGGAAGGGFNDGNLAYIGTGTNASQSINLGAGGLQMAGGGGALSDNAAQIEQLGTGTQTINSNGAIVMAGGSSAGVNVGGTGHGSRASIYSEGSTQTINMLGANRSISLTGGTVGSRNFAQIYAENTGNQVINGASSITLTGGASGGVVGEGNSAYISANSGSQAIAATSITLTGGAAGTENLAQIQQSSSTGATTGTQSITVGGGGAVTLQGGGGTTNLARIRSYGATQTLNYSAGGSLNLTGGTGASLDFARVEAVNGNQNILGSPNITLAGGASGGADLNGNFASITANSATATQTIVSSAMTLNAGAGGINNYAVITAPVQNVTVHGNLAITGGGSATSLDGTTGGGARIGATGGSASTLGLAVDNNITLTGGSVAGAAIGSNVQGGTATAITITAGGNVTLNPGTAATAGARIGSPAAGPAAGDILVTAGGAITLNGATAGETAVRTLGKVTLDGNTLALGNGVSGRALDLVGTSGVTLSGPALLTASDTTGTSILVEAPTGAFVNSASAGAGVLGVAGSARWLVYSTNPLNDTRGGLAYNFKQYGAVPADPVLGTGNGFLYSVVPAATASLVGPVSKTYDGSLAAALTAANLSVTGIDGDVVVLNTPPAGAFDTKNFGSGKTVTASGLSVASASNGGVPVFGYNPVLAPVTGAVGSIGTGSLVISTSDVNKVYDGGTSAAGVPVVSSGSLFGGDSLAGGSFAFTDKNVGTGKTVTVAGVTVNDGNGGANYTVSFANNTNSSISQLSSVNWTGGGGPSDTRWSSATNWTGGAVPDRDNVAVATIPAGAGSVQLDARIKNMTIDSARPIVQSGSSIIEGALRLNSSAGVSLGNSGNAMTALTASNTGAGDVSIVNNSVSAAGALNVVLLTNTGVNIDLTNFGAVTTTGEVNAKTGNVKITANSPLTIGASGVTAGGDITLIASNLTSAGNMTLNGDINAGRAVLLDAAGTLTQNGAVVGLTGVTARVGVGPMVYGPYATTNFAPISYTVNGVAVAAPPTDLFTPTQAADTIVTFLDLFEKAVDEQRTTDLLDTNADGSRKKKKTDDTIVTEGEICR